MALVIERRARFGWPSTPVNGTRAPCRNGMVAHYDGSNQNLANRPHSACQTYWKNTRKFHMNTRAWSDIGYSYGVCPHGVVLEGRGFGWAQAAQPTGNLTWTSVTFMSGPDEKPTVKQIHAWRALRSWLMSKGVGAAVRGHRAFISTSCPGSIIMGLLSNGTLTGGGSTSEGDQMSWSHEIPEGPNFPETWTAETHLRYQSAQAQETNGKLDKLIAQMSELLQELRQAE